jgi:hypothetical protein
MSVSATRTTYDTTMILASLQQSTVGMGVYARTSLLSLGLPRKVVPKKFIGIVLFHDRDDILAICWEDGRTTLHYLQEIRRLTFITQSVRDFSSRWPSQAS